MTPAPAADAASPATPAPGTLAFTAFRGLRFAGSVAGDLASVISPPYDMIDPIQAHRLAQSGAHNIVRLILPELDESDVRLRYRRAARTLETWRAEGALVLDGEPALYVYEQSGPGGLQRGLIGALALPADDAGPVLPHEDVVDAVVADRMALMHATGANPEPILLTYQGLGPASDLVEKYATGRDNPSVAPGRGGTEQPGGDATGATAEAGVAGAAADAAGQAASAHDAADGSADLEAEPIAGSGGREGVEAPLVEVALPDGTCHRLWAMTNAADIATVAADLAHRRSLIADGHHRYAAYQRLASLGRPGSSSGLALLVDSARHPLVVKGIHRWLPDLPVTSAIEEAGKYFTVTPIEGGYRAALAALDEVGPDRMACAVVAGQQAWLVSDPDPKLIAEAVPDDRPETWRRLDATIVHLALAQRVWGVPDTADHIRFDHDARNAVVEAYQHQGLAVLLRPVVESTVAELAAAGVRMPRKSTAFAPKPATGLVLRLLEEP